MADWTPPPLVPLPSLRTEKAFFDVVWNMQVVYITTEPPLRSLKALEELAAEAGALAVFRSHTSAHRQGFVFYDGVRANLVAQQLASVRIEGVLFNASHAGDCAGVVLIGADSILNGETEEEYRIYSDLNLNPTHRSSKFKEELRRLSLNAIAQIAPASPVVIQQILRAPPLVITSLPNASPPSIVTAVRVAVGPPLPPLPQSVVDSSPNHPPPSTNPAEASSLVKDAVSSTSSFPPLPPPPPQSFTAVSRSDPSSRAPALSLSSTATKSPRLPGAPLTPSSLGPGAKEFPGSIDDPSGAEKAGGLVGLGIDTSKWAKADFKLVDTVASERSAFVGSSLGASPRLRGSNGDVTGESWEDEEMDLGSDSERDSAQAMEEGVRMQVGAEEGMSERREDRRRPATTPSIPIIRDALDPPPHSLDTPRRDRSRGHQHSHQHNRSPSPRRHRSPSDSLASGRSRSPRRSPDRTRRRHGHSRRDGSDTRDRRTSRSGRTTSRSGQHRQSNSRHDSFQSDNQTYSRRSRSRSPSRSRPSRRSRSPRRSHNSTTKSSKRDGHGSIREDSERGRGSSRSKTSSRRGLGPTASPSSTERAIQMNDNFQNDVSTVPTASSRTLPLPLHFDDSRYRHHSEFPVSEQRPSAQRPSAPVVLSDVAWGTSLPRQVRNAKDNVVVNNLLPAKLCNPEMLLNAVRELSGDYYAAFYSLRLFVPEQRPKRRPACLSIKLRNGWPHELIRADLAAGVDLPSRTFDSQFDLYRPPPPGPRG